MNKSLSAHIVCTHACVAIYEDQENIPHLSSKKL